MPDSLTISCSLRCDGDVMMMMLMLMLMLMMMMMLIAHCSSVYSAMQ